MKIRLTTWTFVITGITILLYQNREFYLGEQALSLDLLFARWTTPPVAHAVQVLVAFLAGVLLASISLYHERFKTQRKLRQLNIAFQSCAQQVSEQATAECSVPLKKRFRLPAILKKREAEAGSTRTDETQRIEDTGAGTTTT